MIAGCGSPHGGDASDASDGGGPASLVYPVGPYGNAVGQVLPDFTAAGYRLSAAETDSTRLPWDPGIALSEYHADPSCKCLLVTICALWCTACQREQAQLVTEVNAAFQQLSHGDDGGGHVIVLQVGAPIAGRSSRF